MIIQTTTLKQETMKAYVLFLVLLSPCVLGWSVSDRYKKFINQHINQGMSANRCTDVMRSRRITKTNSTECKEINTFIKAGTKEVKKVCGKAGSPYQKKQDMRVSLQPFPVINCNLRNNQRFPRCEYRGRSATRYIVIKCVQGLPVHFEGFSDWSINSSE